jgi:hypothetical protein
VGECTGKVIWQQMPCAFQQWLAWIVEWEVDLVRTIRRLRLNLDAGIRILPISSKPQSAGAARPVHKVPRRGNLEVKGKR